LETEIKLRLARAASFGRRLTRLGFEVTKPRVFESNLVFDTASGALQRGRKLLRLRQAGKVHTITFKGPPVEGRHKSREEVESGFADMAAMQRILEGLGFLPVFRYEKYRTEYQEADRGGVAMLDQTPIGDFLELEGRARWIDRTARELGFSLADYITASYGKLYLEYCEAKGVAPGNMVFKTSSHPRESALFVARP
jgi:adenylate cyclase class 2